MAHRRAASRSSAAGRCPEPFEIGPPLVFDALVPITIVRKPWFAALGRWSVRRSVRRALRRRGLRASAGALLVSYLTQLEAWRSAALAQLQRDLDAEGERLGGEAERLAQDLDVLRRRTSVVR